MRRGRGRRAVVVAAVALAMTGCAGAPTRWQRLDIGDITPDAVGTSGNGWLVAGHRGLGEQTRPAVLTIDPAGTVAEVAVQPQTPYGRIAQPTAISDDDGRVAMLAAARGGAHGNQRWTVWSGSVEQMIEREQVFWVFGGHEAGAMTAQVSTPQGPVVVGGWAGAHGMDVALWEGTADVWQRLPSEGTELASDADSQFSAHDAASSGNRVVVAGESLELRPDLHSLPMLWTRATRGAPVTRIPLPVEKLGDSGRADSVRCEGDQCWIGGVLDGRAALWRLPKDGVAQLAGPPESTVDPDTRVLVTTSDAGVPALLVRQHGRAGLVSPSASEGDVLGPADTPVAAVSSGADSLVIVDGPGGRSLWHLTPRPG